VTTMRAAVLDRLLELLAGHPNLATGRRDSTRLLTHPTAELGRVGLEVIHGGDIRAVTTEPAGMGGPPHPLDLRDDFALDLWVVVTRPGTGAAEARRRAGELLDAVVDTVRAFPRLDQEARPSAVLAGVAACWVSTIDGPHCDIAQEGYLGMGRVEVTTLAHLTTDP
jgi:hypothetical protein